jgi:DNA-binding LytR/AlgR family response regulator
MKIKCITIDDEPLALKQMSSYIVKTPFLELIAACNSAFEAMELIHIEEIDLLFVDINMPDLNGLDFVKSLEKKPLVVFTTAYSEYALEGFKVDAIDYLLKPIGYPDFLKAAQKAEKYLGSSKTQEKLNANEEHLFIKSEYKVIRINLADIKYIEGMREYVRIHLLNAKPVMSLLSMKSIEQKLPQNRFMRVHRSYIVNLKQVSVVERNRIVFDEDVYIPVSEQYKDKFQNYLDKHFLT